MEFSSIKGKESVLLEILLMVIIVQYLALGGGVWKLFEKEIHVLETDHCPLQQCMVKGVPGDKPVLVRAQRRDGSRVIVEVSVAPIIQDNGRVIGGIEVFRDATLEQEMRETKASFLSAITHDLKAPLTVIKGFLELVLTGDAGSVNETQMDFLGSALEECDRLNKILNDLLDLARCEATDHNGEITVHSEPDQGSAFEISLPLAAN
ncbi:MAG: histidine kinase dimerization/phospho-acceptor domain-containing protein [Desulfotomaculaceae bacterium]